MWFIKNRQTLRSIDVNSNGDVIGSNISSNPGPNLKQLELGWQFHDARLPADSNLTHIPGFKCCYE